MAALFQCFGRRQRQNREDFDMKDGIEINGKKCGKKKGDLNCKCDKVNKVLHCSNCKSTLLGYWEHPSGTIDGGTVGKSTNNYRNIESSSWRSCICRDSRQSSEGSDSTSSGDSSPTSIVPPGNVGGNNNAGFYMDYRPSVNADLPGISYMPVSKNDPNYNMNHKRRGKALIFNFNKFDQTHTHVRTLDLEPRHGSDKDKQDLAACLEKLNFEVVIYDNLKRQKYDKIIDKVRREDHSDADCLLVAIMTHGEKNSIYMSDGTLIPVNSVWEEFESNRCPTLAAKPKIFIIQACRGARYDHGTRLASGEGGAGTPVVPNDVIDSGTFSYVIPNAADIIVAFSCPLGHYSWRHPERGSWFIQSICKIFNEHAFQDVELKDLLTMVAREVAINYESSTSHIDSDKKKQVPSTSSTLIRNITFKPKPPVVNGSQITPSVTNGATAQTSTSQNIDNISNSQLINHQVQIAVEEAQSATAIITVPIADIIVPQANAPEIPKLISVSDQACAKISDTSIKETEISPLVQQNGVGDTNEDLGSDEDLSVSTSPEKPILPSN